MTDPKPLSKSVALAAEKSRELRLQRLHMTLGGRIDNPMAVVDQLMAEMAGGEMQEELWEKLHAAAIRDQREAEVGDAYQRAINGPRMKRLPVDAQAAVLMHAADFFQGIRGDLKTADEMLTRVLAVKPENEDAFNRLEKRLEKAVDANGERRLVELYAMVASTPPRKVDVLAQQVLLRLVKLTASTPLSDDAAKKLVALVPANAKILDALEAHCRATKRATLACEIIERAIAEDAAAGAQVSKQRRQRVIELYLGEAGAPAKAMDHIERLLESDPHDAIAFRAGERLMSNRDVSSRATAALQKARRARTQ